MNRNDSHCKKRIFCSFQVFISNSEAQVEICENCGKKVCYYKDEKGRVDNTKYVRDHIRDYIQPYGKNDNLFRKIYGEQPTHDLEEENSRKKTPDQVQQTWEDLRHHAERTVKRQYL